MKPVVLVVACLALVAAAPGRVPERTLSIEDFPGAADEVKSLPGFEGDLPSKLYSGYLNVSATKFIHYVFVESETDPTVDPVSIWLNGGPGCSSLDGFFYEHGPFAIDPTDYGKLTLRDVRWSSVSSMLYLEAPVGVGFSYSTNPTVDYQCTDNSTAVDNANAVEAFFVKFPMYAKNDFFITGESYAGIYVPTLAEEILFRMEDKKYHGAPLKGIAVGNGCSGNTIGICGFSQQGTYYEYKYLLGKAFIDDALKIEINKVCNWTAADEGKDLSKECQATLKRAADEIGNVNLYNVYGDCVGGAVGENEDGSETHSKAPHRSFLSPIKGPNACIDSRAASGYLNRADVIAALHVEPIDFTWGVCNTAKGWNYQSQRPNLPRDTYPALIKNFRVLIYNGDWDACVPFTDNEAWTEGMGLKASEPWHAWSYVTPEGLTNQVGGYAVKYEVGGAAKDSWFRFITVRGGRHEVPESAPDKALEMLTRLIHDGEF